jgi:hypothetical protein
LAGGANRICSCGENIEHCPVWSAVRQEMAYECPGLNYAKAARVTRHLESYGPVASGRLRREYARYWRLALSAIQRVTGADVIVDSSKSSRRRISRPTMLARLCEADLLILHVTRDARAVMWSASRGRNSELRMGLRGPGSPRVARGLAGWVVANVVAEAVQRRHAAGGRVLRYRYEDIARDPTCALVDIERVLGVELDKVRESVRAGQALDAGHGLGGNRFRGQGPVHIREDREWEAGIGLRIRLFGVAVAPLLARYGYRQWI